ncbi:hypothetical protein GCM10025853_16290 [Tetragenococcus halophilus subsp. halophilus DSM 20339]|nr:hypothetical protein GCM10025853_00980 [Tetragenococcus halophilus subsp. halophilus DSM 20339]GMA42679.1 hypothetical protein GCM10025853_01350 [Tetragenococcus halophilus subsp. halophilus DSM 20339]GMA42711.1 hypothetical protein GCM10025853_01670 [Tetragenococcus halophilus subsp. halophilus DSM 20339]GMA44172.1 hypothetical protein GCM10025853_16290 [Tetragenococcus halophilus subsp. halophilus DSM 20339]
MSVIEVEQLTKDYGSHRGVFDVSFEVGEGEVFGFLGPNGAGKTTTIRHLMGFSKPQSGAIKVSNKDSWKDAAAIKREVGYLPGELAFPKNMTGKAFIDFMARERQISDMTKTDHLIDMFELDISPKLDTMSLGTRRKVAIVTAFMHDPDILVLDEPTSGLDPVMQERFIEFLLEEKELANRFFYRVIFSAKWMQPVIGLPLLKKAKWFRRWLQMIFGKMKIRLTKSNLLMKMNINVLLTIPP